LELQDYVAILRRRLWILLTVPILGACVAGLLSYFVLAPVYKASATLWVVKGDRVPLNMEDLMFNRNLVRTYSEVAKSRYILQQVKDRLHLPASVEELQQRLSVSAFDQTEVLRVTVEGEDPELTAATANEVAGAFAEEIENFVRLENVRLLDKALPPTIPDKPRKMLNVILGTGLGGVMALALVFVLEALDYSIRTVADVERHLGIPVMGVIPRFSPKRSSAPFPKEVTADVRQEAP